MQNHGLTKFKLLQIIIITIVIVFFVYGVKSLNKPFNKVSKNDNEIASILPSPSTTPAFPYVKQIPSTVPPTSIQSTSTTSQNIQSNSQNEKSNTNTDKNIAQNVTETSSSTPITQEKNAVTEAVQNVVEEKAATIVSKPVSSDDFLTATSAILGKLSISEMKYIFDSARSDFWVVTPLEEINNIRSILFSKLTDEDLNTLHQLGQKYGRSMTILNKDIDVAKVKEKQVALKSPQVQK